MLNIIKAVVAHKALRDAKAKAAAVKPVEEKGYCKRTVGLKTEVDGYTVSIRKNTRTTAIVVVTDEKNGVSDERVVVHDKRYINVVAARDNGVFDNAVIEMIEELKTLIN